MSVLHLAVSSRPRAASRGSSEKTNGEGTKDQCKKYCLGPNPFAGAERPEACQPNEGSFTMNRRLISYRTKPELADKNADLVAAVFKELAVEKPGGVRYMTLRLDDGTFVHIVETEADDGTSAIPKLAAFQAFQSGVRDRCAEPPVVRHATIVGNYRMLDER
jgi:hypothetical protein